MKWIEIAACICLIGCASPPKHHKAVHHSSKRPATKVSTSEDAATRALIRSLRE